MTWCLQLTFKWLNNTQIVGRKGKSGKMVTTGEYWEITVLFFPWILPFSNLKVREKREES